MVVERLAMSNTPMEMDVPGVATIANGFEKLNQQKVCTGKGIQKEVIIHLSGKPILKVETGTALKVVKMLYEAEYGTRHAILGVRPKMCVDKMPCIITLDESKLNELSYDIMINDGRTPAETEVTSPQDRHITTRCMDCSRESWKSKKFTSVGMNTEISINPLLELDPRTVPNGNNAPHGHFPQHGHMMSPPDTVYPARLPRARSSIQRPVPMTPNPIPHPGAIVYSSMHQKDYIVSTLAPLAISNPKAISPLESEMMEREHGRVRSPRISPSEMHASMHVSSQARYPNNIALDSVPYDRIMSQSYRSSHMHAPIREHHTMHKYRGDPHRDEVPLTRHSPGRSRSPHSPNPIHLKDEPADLAADGKPRSHPPSLIECPPGRYPQSPVQSDRRYHNGNSELYTSVRSHERANHARPEGRGYEYMNDSERSPTHRSPPPLQTSNDSETGIKEAKTRTPSPREEPPVFVLPNDFDVALGVDPRVATYPLPQDRQVPVMHHHTSPPAVIPVKEFPKSDPYPMEHEPDGYGENTRGSASPKSGNDEGSSPDSQNGTTTQRLYCKICHKVFPTKSMLYKHLRAHSSDEKPFKCNECGQGFTLSSNLRQHRIIHRGYKPFQCEFCGKKFMRSNVYKQHRRIHTGEEMHKCGLCPSEFLQKYALIKHMKKSHDIDALDH